MEAVNQLVRSDSELRTSLPIGFAGWDSPPVSVQQTFRRLRSKVASGLPLAEALDELAARFVSRRHQSLEGQLLDLEWGERLKLASIVSRRPDVLFRLWTKRDRICLLIFRKKILFPAFVGPALRFVTASASFRPRDLPGRLTNGSKLVLCRRLVSEGFLRIVSD